MRYLLGILLMVGALLIWIVPAAAQDSISQWASSASATAEEGTWTADQAIGAPDSTGECIPLDHLGWSAPNGSSDSILTVYFDTAVYPQWIDIYTYWTSGSAQYIRGIDLIYEDGFISSIPNGGFVSTCPEVISIPVDPQAQRVIGIQIYVDETSTDGVIDAVNLTGTTSSGNTMDNLAAPGLLETLCGGLFSLPMMGIAAMVFVRRSV